MVVKGDIAKEEFGAVGLAIDLENLEGAFQHEGEPFGAALLKAFLKGAVHVVAVAAEGAEKDERLLGREGLGRQSAQCRRSLLGKQKMALLIHQYARRADGMTGRINGKQEAIAERIDLGLFLRKSGATQE